MLDYFTLEHTAKRYMEYLNGKVNIIRSYYQSYEYCESNISAGEHNGAIVFYCVPLLKMLQPLKHDGWMTSLFCICVHELSHINQMIDYERYGRDSSYKAEIERKNDIATYKWILANADTLRKEFPELDFNLIMRFTEVLDLTEETYSPIDIIDTVRYTLQKFMLKGHNFDSYPNVGLYIEYPDNQQYQLAKYNNTIMNVSDILRMINYLYDYDKYRFGGYIKDNVYVIVIRVDEAWKKLTMACYHNVPHFS